MHCSKVLTAAAVAALAFSAASAKAQTTSVLTFEADEALGVNNGGVYSSTLGVTEGSQSLLFAGTAAGNATFFDIGTVNGQSTGVALGNYNALAEAATRLDNGETLFLKFDLTYDATGVGDPAPDNNGEGFQQIGVTINSDAGFDQLGFGALVGGNIGGQGAFPTVDAAAAAAGVTIEFLDPSDFDGPDDLPETADDDYVGTVRISIPLLAEAPGDSAALAFGTDGDGVFDYAALGFNQNSGYGGTVDFAFDNVVVASPAPVPEPAALGMIAIYSLGLIRRRW